MSRPTFFTFLSRGMLQVKQHGLPLLWHRYFTRNRFSLLPRVQCDENSRIEVHMQICSRDWKNGLWTLFSFIQFTKNPFRLVILSEPPIGDNVKRIYRDHFPGVVFSDEVVTENSVAALLQDSPILFDLWKTKKYFTLPKVVESAVVSNNYKIVTLDPDVVFFAKPTELLDELNQEDSDFAILNSLRSVPAHRDGAYCIDADALQSILGIDLPYNFGTGLGVITPSRFPWNVFQAALNAVPVNPDMGFMLDQTLIAIACAHYGFRRLPTDRYKIEPTESESGVIARHYYSKTRDLMYTQGIPFLRNELKRMGKYPHENS